MENTQTKGLVCKPCKQAYNRAYYARTREAAIAKAKSTYEADRERILEARRLRYALRTAEQVDADRLANALTRAERVDYHRARNAKWRQDNRDRHRAMARDWAAKNPDRVRENQKRHRAALGREEVARALREWYVANPEKVRASRLRRKALLANATTVDFSAEALAARMAYWGNKCWMCQGAFEHVDHVKPLHKRGLHVLANLRPACARCNLSKNASWYGPQELGRFRRITM